MRCVRVGTFFVGGWGGLNHEPFLLGVFIGGLGDFFLLEWGVEFFT